MVLVFRKSISSILKFLFVFCHLALHCRDAKNSLCHRHQNSSEICWTLYWILLQRRRLYKSGCLKSPGVGKTKLDFIESRLIGLNGGSLSISFKVFTVKGLKFTTDSTSFSSVISDSSFKLVPCCFSNADSITLADFIWRSQTPPMWLPEGRLFFYVTHSVPPFCRRCDIVFIHFRKGPLKFWFGINEISTIVTSYQPYVSSTSYKLS